ncbi:MAG: SH3 domain-containing protein [Nitrospiraceae bacterium]
MTLELEEKLARVQLALLERDTQVQHLHKQLDEAIQETVRSKAKLVSQESRAEAASSLAEAEVALKTLKNLGKGVEKRLEYTRAAMMMKLSTDELIKENYGGSLFATNQVKAQIRDLNDVLESEQPGKSDAAPAGKPAAASEFESRLAKLQAMLAEKDAQVQSLSKKLAETIQETVRSKARLRSQENKAEAASGLAEAEVALKTLQDAPAEAEKRPEIAPANALMAMGADELKKENYSGSLYLTNQVKALVKDVQEKTQGLEQLSLADGETLFALPLPLKSLAGGKVREQPTADAAVAWSVERGAPLTAYSSKGLWVHVKGDGERWGWIFYNLIAGP